MALPDYTTQDPATYKANIDASISLLSTKTAIRSSHNGAQTITTGSTAVVEYIQSDYDVLSELDVTTNKGRVTPNNEGFYFVSAIVTVITEVYSAGEANTISIATNGSLLTNYTEEIQASSTLTQSISVSGLVYCNGTTDYFDIRYKNGSSTTCQLLGSTTRLTQLSVHKI